MGFDYGPEMYDRWHAAAPKASSTFCAVHESKPVLGAVEVMVGWLRVLGYWDLHSLGFRGSGIGIPFGRGGVRENLGSSDALFKFRQV